MLTVYFTKGLPACGKSTWAKEFQQNHPEMTIKRINKDDLRAMLDNGKWSGNNEKFVLRARDMLILAALDNGHHIIVDDTNLHPKHEDAIRELIKGKAELEVVDFTHVDVDICLARDRNRPNYVGEKVIRKMYNQFLMKPVEPIVQDDNLPLAVICDLDGTLALMNGRGPFDWKECIYDKLNKNVDVVVSNFVDSFSECHLLIVSGRDSVCEEETRDWLEKNDIHPDQLFMRAQGDMRKDVIVKKEIFDNHIRGKYNVIAVFDDRNQVVEFWRSMGLTVFQVADGDF